MAMQSRRARATRLSPSLIPASSFRTLRREEPVSANDSSTVIDPSFLQILEDRCDDYERKLSELYALLDAATRREREVVLELLEREKAYLKLKADSDRELGDFFDVQSKLMDEIEELYRENLQLKKTIEGSTSHRVRSGCRRLKEQVREAVNKRLLSDIRSAASQVRFGRPL